MEAEIILEYEDAKTAEAIAKAVSPDNFKTPRGLSIKTKLEEKKVVTQVRCKRGLLTFVATIDDLLFCTTTAEKTIQTTRKLK